MKKILIVERELQGKLPENKRIMFKKNKTIIKDNKILDDDQKILDIFKENSIGINDYSWYLEEWEVFNEIKVQLICGNSGTRLRPVHIISSLSPRNGAKALFQSKKLVVFKMQDGVFELSKNVVDDGGNTEVNVLCVGEYTSILQVKSKLGSDYLPMINSYIKNKGEFLNNYLSPIWGES